MIHVAILEGRFAIARLAAGDPVPEWAREIERATGSFVSITRTPEELSILAPDDSVPAEVKSERAFRCIRVSGPLPFDAVGILAALTAPIAAAGIPLFTISTYDTDYIFVREVHLTEAVEALARSGGVVTSS